MSTAYRWKPLVRASAWKPPSEALIAAWMEVRKCDRETALHLMDEELKQIEHWRNDLYQVEVRRYPDVGMVHLNVRRLDGYPAREWRHLQQIKNELVGPECEGVELYPAESRLTDTSNKFHLYCCTDPAFRFPFGFDRRDVQYGNEKEGGLRQQPPMKFAKS